VALQPCDAGNDAQVWEINDTRRITRTGRCLDLNGGNLTNNLGTLITYGCTGGANQQWGGLVAHGGLALTLVDAAHARQLARVEAEVAARTARP
jgi:hypothetical protein